MTVKVVGKVSLPPGGADYLQKLLSEPKNRAVVSRILNQESEKVKAICEEIAEEDIHRRPDDRRTRESLAHGAEYHESFVIITAKDLGAGKMKTGVTNTHPFARAVERGTPRHDIPSSGWQKFPWNLQRNGPSKGAGMGNFIVSGPLNARAQLVDHPGAGAKRIMGRARRRYLDRAKRVLNG